MTYKKDKKKVQTNGKGRSDDIMYDVDSWGAGSSQLGTRKKVLGKHAAQGARGHRKKSATRRVHGPSRFPFPAGRRGALHPVQT